MILAGFDRKAWGEKFFLRRECMGEIKKIAGNSSASNGEKRVEFN